MEENCTVCMLCARECPAWCIYIDSHKETSPPATAGGRERSHNMLDRFAIDFSLCMYCGICIEVCPFDALHWSPEFEYAEFDIRELTHEKDRLQRVDVDRPAAARARPARGRAGQGDRDRREGGRAASRRPAATRRATDDVTAVEVLFVLLGVMAVGSALLVATSSNLVHCALWLVVTLGALAGCYLLLAAEFVAWVQVLIYVGAVVVLLLFALMLTRAPTGALPDLTEHEPVRRRRWSDSRPRGAADRPCFAVGFEDARIDIGDGDIGQRVAGRDHVFGSWVLPFEMLSVLLLAALVGAIVLSRARPGGRR